MIIFLTNLVKTLFNRQIRLSQILAPVFQYIRKPTIPTYSLEISTNFEKGCREDYFEAPECFLFKHRQIINSVLIANKLLDLVNQVFFANWILKRPMIMSIGSSYCTYWGGVTLERNCVIGWHIAFLWCASLLW